MCTNEASNESTHSKMELRINYTLTVYFLCGVSKASLGTILLPHTVEAFETGRLNRKVFDNSKSIEYFKIFT